MIFAQFRLDIGQIQLRKNPGFSRAGHEQFRVARFFLRFEQAVFVEPQTSRNGSLTHDDVVLLVAGKIHQREGIFLVADHAQVGLNAALQNHARLGVALGRDFDDPGLRDEEFDHRSRFL